MPQTRFVLRKALAKGLKAVVVLNKCDREGARFGIVEDEVPLRIRILYSLRILGCVCTNIRVSLHARLFSMHVYIRARKLRANNLYYTFLCLSHINHALLLLIVLIFSLL